MSRRNDCGATRRTAAAKDGRGQDDVAEEVAALEGVGDAARGSRGRREGTISKMRERLKAKTGQGRADGHDVDLAVRPRLGDLGDLGRVAVVDFGRVELASRNLRVAEDAGARGVDEDGLALLLVEPALGGRLEALDDGLGRLEVIAVGGGDDWRTTTQRHKLES
jgi:hypothetical protein